jgi:outer membrane lipoprotein-sorting protein
MKRFFLFSMVLGAVLGFLFTSAGVKQVAAQEPSAEEIMKQAHMNLYYAADDMKTTVEMELTNKKGKTRTRKFVMLRMDVDEGGAQKYYTYFLEPTDVRKTTFMVWKDPQKDDSRWIYVPSVDLVRRISANDKGSSFVGSDFSYEDVSGRHWTEDNHTLVKTEELDGKSCYVIESIPKEKDSFSKKVSWISVDEMLPMKEEYYDRKDRLERVFKAEEVQEVGGHLTITRRSMTNVKKEHTTNVTFTEIEYDTEVEDGLFTERFLKAPPPSLVSN